MELRMFKSLPHTTNWELPGRSLLPEATNRVPHYTIKNGRNLKFKQVSRRWSVECNDAILPGLRLLTGRETRS